MMVKLCTRTQCVYSYIMYSYIMQLDNRTQQARIWRTHSLTMPSFTHHAVDLQLEAKRPRDVAQLDDVWDVERAGGLDRGGGVMRADHLRKHHFIAVTHQQQEIVRRHVCNE